MASKYALLVGINRYPHYTGDRNLDLKGCVNDTQLIKKIILEKFEFQEANIVELLDEAATREAILNGLDRLVDQVSEDDVVLFQFSGHGRHRYPASDDLDEGTGHNSTLMPSDSGPAPIPNRDINDNEIQDWLDRITLKTPNVTVIVDSCHSGTISRDAFGPLVRTMPPDERTRGVPAPEPRSQSAARSAASPGAPTLEWLASDERYVVISACEDLEYAREVILDRPDGEHTLGRLTYYLSQALSAAGSDATYRDIYEDVSRRVAGEKKQQHPQIAGSVDRQIFGTGTLLPLNSIAVESVTTSNKGTHVILAAGEAQGVEVGSTWSIYPAATKNDTQVETVGTLRIERVLAVQAHGELLEHGQPIQPGARCVLQDATLDQDSNAQKLAHYLRIRAMRSASPKLDLGFDLLRVSEPGKARAVTDARPTLGVGDCLGFKVTNNTKSPIYYSIVHLRANGQIRLLFPPNAYSARLEPGRSVQHGVDRIMRLCVDAEREAVGEEMFKLWVTPAQTDLGWITQSSISSTDEWPGAKPETLPSLASGASDPAPDRADKLTDKAWQVIDRPILLKA